LDAEYINTINWKKSSFAWRAFAGFGMPVGKGDSSLPFFKQYFAGGPSSMRGWPIRGIGPGAKPLSAYNERLLADRTGDIRIELSAEYRYNILQIRPNSIYLRGTFFVDAGNIWNMKNTTPNGGYDSLQFKLNLKDIYRQTGVSAGAGFHLDFTYFMIRFDFGFRFKRPDILTNDGWQFPGLSLKKIFAKGELVPDPNNPGSSINDERYRIWRHENFNFSIGLNYPF
jgi:outer membrane protein assembly factor BamA